MLPVQCNAQLGNTHSSFPPLSLQVVQLIEMSEALLGACLFGGLVQNVCLEPTTMSLQEISELEN